MSKEVIYHLLHSEILRLLEGWGRRDLALDVERRGQGHPVYDFLDRALSPILRGIRRRKLSMA